MIKKIFLILLFPLFLYSQAAVDYQRVKTDTLKSHTLNGEIEIQSRADFHFLAKSDSIQSSTPSAVVRIVDTLSAIRLQLDNPLITTYGGTGLTSWTQGDIPYYNSGTALSKLALGSSNQILGVSNAAPAPEYKTFQTTTTGTDFTISYSGSNVNFNLPTASASNRGAYSTTDYSRTAFKNESNTFSAGTTQTMPRAVIDTLLASPENVLEVAKSGRQYTTIQAAINASSYGDIIFVYSGTYSENIRFLPSDSGKILIGLDLENTIINGTVLDSAKDTKISGFTINEKFTVHCTSTHDSTLRQRNNFKDLKFLSSVFVGSQDSSNVYGVRFENCMFYGNSDTLLIKQYGDWNNRLFFVDCRTELFTSNLNYKPYTVLCYSGYILFHGFDYLYFWSIMIDAQYGSTNLGAEYGGVLSIASQLYGVNNSTNFTIFHFSGFELVGNVDSTWTFTGNFEFDIWRSSFWMPNIVWNSSAPSRWYHVEQRPFNSAATLTISTSNTLAISNSLFKIGSPSGLLQNTGNTWYSWIDY